MTLVFDEHGITFNYLGASRRYLEQFSYETKSFYSFDDELFLSGNVLVVQEGIFILDNELNFEQMHYSLERLPEYTHVNPSIGLGHNEERNEHTVFVTLDEEYIFVNNIPCKITQKGNGYFFGDNSFVETYEEVILMLGGKCFKYPKKNNIILDDSAFEESFENLNIGDMNQNFEILQDQSGYEDQKNESFTMLEYKLGYDNNMNMIHGYLYISRDLNNLGPMDRIYYNSYDYDNMISVDHDDVVADVLFMTNKVRINTSESFIKIFYTNNRPTSIMIEGHYYDIVEYTP